MYVADSLGPFATGKDYRYLVPVLTTGYGTRYRVPTWAKTGVRVRPLPARWLQVLQPVRRLASLIISQLGHARLNNTPMGATSEYDWPNPSSVVQRGFSKPRSPKSCCSWYEATHFNRSGNSEVLVFEG